MCNYLSSRPIPARHCAEYLHFKTNPLYQLTVVLTAKLKLKLKLILLSIFAALRASIC